MTRVAAHTRSGISLLEVLVAMAIFLVSMLGIGQLITLGADRARDVQQQAQAIQLCQSKLAEVVAGVLPVSSSQGDTPFDEDPAWTWAVDSEQGSVTNLWNVTVRVSRRRPDGSKVETSLSQMIFDPTVRGSVPAASSGSGSSGSSSSGSTGSSSTGTGSTSP